MHVAYDFGGGGVESRGPVDHEIPEVRRRRRRAPTRVVAGWRRWRRRRRRSRQSRGRSEDDRSCGRRQRPKAPSGLACGYARGPVLGHMRAHGRSNVGIVDEVGAKQRGDAVLHEEGCLQPERELVKRLVRDRRKGLAECHQLSPCVHEGVVPSGRRGNQVGQRRRWGGRRSGHWRDWSGDAERRRDGRRALVLFRRRRPRRRRHGTLGRGWRRWRSRNRGDEPSGRRTRSGDTGAGRCPDGQLWRDP